MLFGTDDDDIDFSLSAGGGSSKLAGLFSDQGEVKNGNQSLKYTAPKQPKKSEAQSTPGSQTVLHAVAVTAYKYDGGKYNNRGKVGAAILGSHDPPVYKIIIYKTKQQPLTTVAIASNFEFTVQPNNYTNFYDDYSVNWSILFDKEEAACEFARQVALCKANSIGSSLATTLIQDLTIGEGNELLENGDSVEMKYTGWIMTNHGFGEVFDSNENANKLFRLKLGRGKAIKGMEEGLLGARKNAKRFLIIPPSLGYGSQGVGNKVPPNSTLIFEVFINKAKFAKESRSSTPTTHEIDSGSDTRRKDTLTKPHSESLSNEDTIRARGASISEQLSQSPKTEKAKIISRMAKMGMSLLPMQSGTQPSSESETEDELQSRVKGSPSFHHESSREQSPKPVPKPRSASNVTTVPQQQSQMTPLSAQQMAVLQPQQQYMSNSVYPFPYHSAATAPFNMIQQPFPSHAVATASPTVMTSVADSHFPILLAETRTQNTEVRLALGKITEKVDVVIHKLDDAKQQSGFSGQIPYLDSSILLQNIQRIVQENNNLKQEMDDKNGKIQLLNEKICDLLQRNQRFIEESNNMLEQRSDSLHSTASQSHARLLTLEQERVKLTAELSETISKLSSLQLELTTRQHLEAEMQTQLQTATNDMQRQKQETESLKLKVEEQENLISSLQLNVKEMRQQKKELENRIEELEETSLDLKNSKGILEKNLLDKKQQLTNASQQAEKEVEELRLSHEKEIEMLRNKLLKQRTLPSSEQISQLENDIESKWKKQSEQMASEATEKYRREINELKEQKEEIENKLEEVESNLERTRVSHRSENDRIFQLEEEIEQLKQWKSMYDSLHKNAEHMKKEYESQVAHLTRQLRQGNASLNTDSVNFSAELKNAMNKLYRSLQATFQPEDSYVGSSIRQLALNIIREITFEILELKQSIPATVDETDNSAKAKENKVEEETTEKASTSTAELHNTKTEEEVKLTQSSTVEISNTHTEIKTIESNIAEEFVSDSQTFQTENNSSSNLEIPSTETKTEDMKVQEPLSDQCDQPSAQFTSNRKDSSISESATTEREQENESCMGESNNLPSNTFGDLQQTESSSVVDHLNADEKISGKESGHIEDHTHVDSNDGKASQEPKKTEELTDMSWKPQPPPPPLFDDEDEDEDDWLK